MASDKSQSSRDVSREPNLSANAVHHGVNGDIRAGPHEGFEKDGHGNVGSDDGDEDLFSDDGDVDGYIKLYDMLPFSKKHSN